MHTVIALVMPYPLSNIKMFDLKTYISCKPFLVNKDKKIAQQCLNQIEPFFRNSEEKIDILDVGSGDASLIERIIDLLKYKNNQLDKTKKKIVVNCVEPETEGQEKISLMAQRVQADNFVVRSNKVNIQDYLLGSSKCYNVILCIHTLYHIDKSEWLQILKNMLKHLKPGGIIITNLVSHESSIYSLLETINPLLGNLERTFYKYGELYFAEDFENISKLINRDVSKIKISSTISFERKDYLKCVPAHCGKKLNGCEMLDFLSFMFRISRDDFKIIGKDIIVQLIESANDVITFTSIDKMFIIRRDEK